MKRKPVIVILAVLAPIILCGYLLRDFSLLAPAIKIVAYEIPSPHRVHVASVFHVEPGATGSDHTVVSLRYAENPITWDLSSIVFFQERETRPEIIWKDDHDLLIIFNAQSEDFQIRKTNWNDVSVEFTNSWVRGQLKK